MDCPCPTCDWIDGGPCPGIAVAEEVERLSFRQLTLYDEAGKEVFTMTIGPQRCGWSAGSEPISGIFRVEITDGD